VTEMYDSLRLTLSVLKEKDTTCSREAIISILRHPASIPCEKTFLQQPLPLRDIGHPFGLPGSEGTKSALLLITEPISNSPTGIGTVASRRVGFGGCPAFGAARESSSWRAFRSHEKVSFQTIVDTS
jgi:hypothetical protein